MQKVLSVCHLYGNLLNTYGDNGNLLVLQWLAKKAGLPYKSQLISLGQPFCPQKYNFVFIGGGQDYEQRIVAKDIQGKKGPLAEYIQAGGVMLAVCAGFQLLGEYYVAANGEKVPGAFALPHRTEAQQGKRFIGEISVCDKSRGESYCGFENHSGRTFLGAGQRPLGTVLQGSGNNGQDKTEGAIYKNTFCTYLHGPVLARNLALAQHMLALAQGK